MKVKEMMSKYGFEETVSKLEKSVEENGLKIISTIDAQANLKKIGIEIEGNKILEVFNPKLAKEVFEKDLKAGIVPPLRIYIYQENDSTHVVAQSAVDLFSQYNGLRDLGERVDKLIDSIVNSVTQ
ncbi:DUF302 domain-containing protein [Cuniculiplasma sp. SKW4]|uniref:DUF302 domain-containing protein n=1 Tax=Cuniculiplasma sp. SKW4 TaxID=3400171 RepID=UPI003FD00830